ncbi:MAG TPA: GGDEF domain-containing protein [Moraxellaceae bacterium]|nr:GGDEF domain-containing protein [Moraxellaceae bacterium]
MCLLAIAFSFPVFLGHWLVFASWLSDAGFAQVAQRDVIADLNDCLLVVLALDVALMAWLWPRRKQAVPLPRAAMLVVLVQVVGYVAMGIAYGPITSPMSTVTISALVVGLALLGQRPMLVGFVVALVVITFNDLLVLSGRVTYAPALLPSTFSAGVPVHWWGMWQNAMFAIAILVGLSLMLLLFNRLDAQRLALESLSRTDGLTGLSNRRYYMERLAIEQQRRDRYRQSFSVVLCDADHFKRVNDTYGHHAGDEVLVAIGRLLNAGLRIPGDVAARLGGEEFALLLTDCRADEARTVCERLRRQLADLEFGTPGRHFRVTLSMGVVECAAGSAEEALRSADINLYRAKADGRDRIVTSVQEAAP